MGKKAKVSVEEPVDGGTPGEYYFAEPKVITIPSPKPAPSSNVSQFPRSPSTMGTAYSSGANTYGEGVCRMASCHTIKGYTPPNGIEYHLGRWPSKLDASAYLDMMAVQGYGVGSIVCRKYQPLEDHPKVYLWGVILMVHNHQTSAEYKPYLVKWFGDGRVESAWAEDLYLVHARLDKTLFHDILESQGCDFEDFLEIGGVT
jgi:hypothetical protein